MPYFHCICSHEFESIDSDPVCDWCGRTDAECIEDETPLGEMLCDMDWDGFYTPEITVICRNCGTVKEVDTEFINIEEDIQGADVLTFKCPTCNTVQKSRRFG